MGVPKFFRYTSERYPCLNELVKQYQIPDFDNMYLDMNGIIHNCSHPDDSNPHFRITEEKIFQDVFHYISILFQIIKPKKLFFMAIDGVAPRAKMNQQRGRRFRSAREAEKLEEDAKAKGEVLPSEERFDSNCITPGTVFMARLHEQLRYFVKEKMSTDPMWAKVKVILSGHETPGEGEHKIMDYIRWARSQPEYDPNTRHCLYGLDADLIMLGMCTHEPHFALLREEVKFGKTTQRSTSPEETNFFLLHLSLLREYLEQEFITIKDKLPFEYDIEKVVDDWVLMGFLVGNDFIPNLPNMHIAADKDQDALPLLYRTYMEVLPTLDGYINEAGDLNLQRFEVFMQELAKIDKVRFQDDYADLKYFEAKTGRRPNANERKVYKPNNDETFNVDFNEIKLNKPDDALQALIDATQEMYMDDLGDGTDDEDGISDTSDEEATFNLEFKLHKKDYYMNKLDYSKVTDEVLMSQAEGYVRAIQWNLWYYYRGCQSWGWYYPHHYAPYMSDIKGFKDYKIEFEMGTPFKPFEQLLAVLPAASKHLLPTPFHPLMTDDNSPILHYYPINFETDLNGKKNDWEAVVLIPFINEESLLSAMEPCYLQLTEAEKKRNTHGPMLVYNWVKDSLGPENAPQYFPTIADNHAAELKVWREELDVPLSQLKRGVLPNAIRHMLFPGFPTMRHLKYQTSIKVCKVKVFDQPSRKENMIVSIIRDDPKDPPLETVAENMLGKTVWIGWPHLAKAKVVSVSNEKERLHHSEKGPSLFTREANMGNMHKQWISERSTIFEHNMGRMGIELGDVNTIIHAVNLKGYKYIVQNNTEMAFEPVWCTNPCGYAYQAVLQNVQTFIMDTPRKYCSAQEAYPHGAKLFLVTPGEYYGCSAQVLDSGTIRSGRIKVQVTDNPQPIPIVSTSACQYKTANHAAASVGISTQLLSRVTGSVLVIPGPRIDGPTEGKSKINIGVNLKFNKKNQEVAGYTRRCPVTNQWQYSKRCIDLVSEFVEKFPDLFNKLAYTVGNDIFYEGELFPNEVGQGKLQEVAAWLKAQPQTKALKRECGSEALEPEELVALARGLDEQRKQLKESVRSVPLQVKWHLIYKPDLHEGNIPPDPKADFQLYDRVVSVASNITVPIGYEGTITAIYHPGASNTVRLSDKMNAEPMYQVLFDEPFAGALHEEGFEEPRLYRMPPTFLLNISFGRKLRDAVKPAPPKEQNNYTLSKPPNILRREDGHNSAFASYSPTKEHQMPPVNARINAFTRAPPIMANSVPNTASRSSNTVNVPAVGPVQDSSELLKSLLKISDNNDSKPSSKPKGQPLPPPPEPQQNWRVKKQPTPAAPPPRPGAVQQVNWRHESTPQYNSVAPPPNYATNLKGHQKQPLLPYPNFNQCIQGPKLGQIPLPQFQNPHFQQRNHPSHQSNNKQPQFVNQSNNQQFNQLPSPVQNDFGGPNMQRLNATVPQPGASFPQNLPNVLMPSGFVNQSAPVAPFNANKSNQPNANLDKLINPFVPLQVQASQRRVKNPSGPSNFKTNPATQPPANQVPEFNPAQTQVQGRPDSSVQPPVQNKPKRQRRPKIAASLPFDTSFN